MPIAVQCPGCKSKLNAPDAAAGKKLKCPKCAKALTVPAEEFEVVEDFEEVNDDFEIVADAPKKPAGAAVRSRARGEDDDEPPRKPKKRAVVEDEDDEPPRKSKKRAVVEDDDEDDDRPKKKKGKKKPAPKSNLPLFIGIGAVVLLLIAGGLFVALKGKKGGSGMDAGGLVKFDAPDGSFSALFPNAPSETNDDALLELVGEDKAKAAQAKEATKGLNWTHNSWMSVDGTRRYVVSRVKFPGEVPDPTKVEGFFRDAGRQNYLTLGKLLGEESVSMAGRSVPAARIKLNNGKTFLSFFFIKGDCAYDIDVIDDGDVTFADDNVKKFIESFSVGGGAAPSGKVPEGRPKRGG